MQQFVQETNPYAGREGLIYARVSSKRQELDGSGLQSQEGRCLADLQSVKIPHLKTFRDSFSGGGDFMRRPAMRELLAYTDAHPHKKFVVVFDDLKRFARDAKFHFELKTALKIRDIKLRCLNYNFDESPEGQFAELIFAGHSELERHQNARQVIQKMKARLDLGYWPFAGRRGYDMLKNPMHGKLHVANKEGRTSMREALEGFASGKLLRKVDVARFLFERGFWKKSKRTAEHFSDEASVLLQDVFHAGYVEYPPWGVARRKGQHKGIISLETFELIQKRLQREETKARVRTDISPEFPLRGLLLCPGCSNKLTGAISKGRSKTYSYYYCVQKGCPLYAKALSKADVERDFRNLLQRNRLKDDVDELLQLTFDRVWREEVHDLKRQQLLKERQHQGLREKVRELSELARTTRLDEVRRAYEEQIEETLNEIKQGGPTAAKHDLGVPYRTALDKSTTLLKNPVTIWDKVGVIEKHRLFFFLFEKKLEYTKGYGYRTANELSTARLFEEFVDANSDDVDRTGFEPATPSLQMRCSTN